MALMGRSRLLDQKGKFLAAAVGEFSISGGHGAGPDENAFGVGRFHDGIQFGEKSFRCWVLAIDGEIHFHRGPSDGGGVGGGSAPNGVKAVFGVFGRLARILMVSSDEVTGHALVLAPLMLGIVGRAKSMGYGQSEGVLPRESPPCERAHG